MEYLTIGTIVQTHGLKGEVKIYSTTDFSNERYKKGNKVLLIKNNSQDTMELEIKAHHKVGPFDYVTFVGYEDINLVQDFLKCELRAEKDTIKLPKDSYFISDLKNCIVYNEENIKLGIVKEVNDYVGKFNLKILMDNGKTFTVPFVNAFIKKIDLSKKTILIHVIEGML